MRALLIEANAANSAYVGRVLARLGVSIQRAMEVPVRLYEHVDIVALSLDREDFREAVASAASLHRPLVGLVSIGNEDRGPQAMDLGLKGYVVLHRDRDARVYTVLQDALRSKVGVWPVIAEVGAPKPIQDTGTPIPSELEFLFRNSQDMMCIADSEGYLRRVNPAFSRHLGYSADELRQVPFINFVHPDDRERTQLVFSRLLAQGGEQVSSFENRYKAKTGTYHWLSWNAVSQPDGEIYATARDVTANKASTVSASNLEDTIQKALASFTLSSSTVDQVEKTGSRVWKVVQWVGAALAAVFMAGVAYKEFVLGNATKADINSVVEVHRVKEFGPYKEKVDQIEEDLSGVKTGVEQLVVSEQERVGVEKKQRLLEAYRSEYQEAMAEYAADKAAGRSVPRPRKTRIHIELEDELFGK